MRIHRIRVLNVFHYQNSLKLKMVYSLDLSYNSFIYTILWGPPMFILNVFVYFCRFILAGHLNFILKLLQIMNLLC